MKQELFSQLQNLWVEFEKEHAGTTKKSQAAARKALSNVKKLISQYNKASVAESKEK